MLWRCWSMVVAWPWLAQHSCITRLRVWRWKSLKRLGLGRHGADQGLEHVALAVLDPAVLAGVGLVALHQREGVEADPGIGDVDEAAAEQLAQVLVGLADVDHEDLGAQAQIRGDDVVGEEALARAGFGGDRGVVVGRAVEQVEAHQLARSARRRSWPAWRCPTIRRTPATAAPHARWSWCGSGRDRRPRRGRR